MGGRVFPSLDNPPFRVFVYFVPFPNLSLLSNFFLNFLLSFSEKWSQTLFMLELKQPYYDHLIIQSNKSLNFLTRRNKWSIRECFVDKPRSERSFVLTCFVLENQSKILVLSKKRRKVHKWRSFLNIFVSTLIKTESTSYGARWNVPPASHMKQSVRVIVCGGMTGRGLTTLHKLPAGQTLTSGHYMNQILKKG